MSNFPPFFWPIEKQLRSSQKKAKRQYHVDCKVVGTPLALKNLARANAVAYNVFIQALRKHGMDRWRSDDPTSQPFEELPV